jgi:hypothetical protein
MPQDKLALAKQLVGEGMDRHDALRRFIALGVSTEDFQSLFTQALAELGMPEPTAPMPTHLETEKAFIVKAQKSPMVMMLVGLMATITFFGGVFFFVTEDVPNRILDFVIPTGSMSVADSDSQSEQVTFSDAVLKKKIESTMASVRIYKGRMLDYQGVCTDVAVVPPVTCKEMTNSVVVYAKDKNGALYCVDGTGKSGSRIELTKTAIACK